MAKLQLLRQVREKLLRKLADPADRDAPEWTKRWLRRLEKRLARKEKAAEHKRQQGKVGRSRRIKDLPEI